MDDLNWFLHLPAGLLSSIEHVGEIGSALSKEKIDSLLQEYGRQKVTQLYIIFLSWSAGALLESKHFSQIYAYHYLKKEKRLYFEELLFSKVHIKIIALRSEDQVFPTRSEVPVLLARPEDSRLLARPEDSRLWARPEDSRLLARPEDSRLLAMKWFRKGQKNMNAEISVYRRLARLGCPLPFFSTKYRFWNDPVLVMERMDSLDEEDDPREVGAQVLRQLSYLHTFAVHSDIKPHNIMRASGRPIYFLIDYGGVANQKLGHGYLRTTWSEEWTSQKFRGQRQITTAKHDFLELGYTLRSLQENPDYKELDEYDRVVEDLSEESIPREIYSRLENILKSRSSSK